MHPAGDRLSVIRFNRPVTSCVRFSPNAAPSNRELTNHLLSIIMVNLSRDSACATSLAKYCTQAREAMPTLATKRLHPHSMRHSPAVHLLRSGVDIVTISQWLGHASVTTTNRYTTVDLEMKRKAIEQA